MRYSSIIDSNSNETILDCYFNYKMYNPTKRSVTKQTCRGSYTQRSVPLFLHGSEFVEWSIEITTAPTAKLMYSLYNSGEQYTFKGAFGEEYLVDFERPEVEQIGGYWKMSGKMRVICVIKDFDFCFNCTEDPEERLPTDLTCDVEE